MNAVRMATIAGLCLSLLILPDRAGAQLPAAEELRHLRPADGIEIELFAAEPLVTNPAAIDVDTHGRVWVAELQFYRKFADQPPADKIKVLEDTDGDGRADRSTVFAEGLFCPMSVCVAGSKVYVATSPDLWVFEDNDGDLKTDGPPKKLLTGFGGFNHDHGAHSLVLGPDHKWYMSHGDQGFDVTGVDGSAIKYRWGAMLRGELDGSRLEIVARNFRNPYELCLDSFGNVYCSDNDNDGNQSARICWIIPGGDYGWFGSPPNRVAAAVPFGEHWHFRGYVPGFVPATLVTGFGSPCGICFYEGRTFGDQLANKPLHADAGPREVRAYPHELAGYGMRATSRVFLTSQGDDYFRPDDVCAAPDGTLLVADWYDGGVGGHAYNNPGQGRIFRLKPKGGQAQRVAKPGPYETVDDAIVALANPNLATQYLARERLLAEPGAAVPRLAALLNTDDATLRARALWLLDRSGGDARRLVAGDLTSPDARFRALAVRILGQHGGEHESAILTLANDGSDEVRREVLLAIRNWNSDAAFDTLLKLAREYDGRDRYQCECLNVAASDRRDKLFAALVGEGLFDVERFDLFAALDDERANRLIVERLQDDKTNDAQRAKIVARLAYVPDPAVARAVWQVACDKRFDQALRSEALRVVGDNLDGEWKALVQDDSFQPGIRRLAGEAGFQVAAIKLIGRTGLPGFDQQILKFVSSPDTGNEALIAAIEAAGKIRIGEAAGPIEARLSDREPQVSAAALTALVELESWPAVKQALTGKTLGDEAKRALVERMMTTPGGALALERLIEADQLSPELKELSIAKAIDHPDNNVRVVFDRLIPSARRPRALGSDVDMAEILSLAGDARRGRQIFMKSSAAQCNKCHAVGGKGGNVGPNLDQIGKKYERQALLETILQPSKAIAPEFVPYVLETKGGQAYSGLIAERTADEVVLKDAEGKLVRTPAGEVAALEPQTKSIMPELLLRDVTAQDAADLLAFLTTLGAR